MRPSFEFTRSARFMKVLNGEIFAREDTRIKKAKIYLIFVENLANS